MDYSILVQVIRKNSQKTRRYEFIEMILGNKIKKEVKTNLMKFFGLNLHKMEETM